MKNGLYLHDGSQYFYVDNDLRWKINLDGDKHWYLNGERHREDGPAVEYITGAKCWYQNGKFHREDGPAIDNTDGSKYWYLNDQWLTEEEFNKRMKK